MPTTYIQNKYVCSKAVLETYLGEVMMVRHLIPGVQRPNGPNDGLALVGQHRQVQLISSLQGSLVCDDGVAVSEDRVHQLDRVCILLSK